MNSIPKSLKDKRVKIAVIFLAIAITCSVIVLVSSNFKQDIAQAENTKDIATNEDGLTYGTVYLDDANDQIMPDLARVVATNGEEGYVNVEEMTWITAGSPKSAEENYELGFVFGEMEANAYKDALNEYYGVDALSFEDADDCRILLATDSMNCVAETSQRASDVLVQEIKQGNIKNEKAAGLIEEAIEKKQISRDNIATTISKGISSGKVNVDTFTKAAPEKNSLSKKGQELEKSDILANVKAMSADELAMVLVESGELSLINKEHIMIPEAAFSEIYESMQSKTCFSVPVYKEDGKTVIGEYIVNIM